VHINVLFRDGVRAHHDPDPVSFFQKGFKCIDMGSRGITNDQAGGQMNNFSTVFDHLFSHIFYVAAGAAVTGAVSNQLDLAVCVQAKGPFPVSHCAQALAARTAAVAIANHYSDLRFGTHFYPFHVFSIATAFKTGGEG